MKKKLKYAGLLLLAGFIIIQFFQPEQNASPAYSGHRMEDAYKVPRDIQLLLSNSCYDCHSNNSTPMWYMKVQPIGWWISHHIEEGKDELNFDEFGTYSLRRQYHKFEEIVEMIEEDEMPLYSYTIVHDRAVLSEADKESIISWANNMRTWMKETYPEDSLIRKR